MKLTKPLLMPLASAILCALPFRFTRSIARVAGLLYYLTSKARRHTLDTNLRHILCPACAEVIRRYVRKTFENLALCIIDLLQIPRLNRNWLLRMVEDRWRRHLDLALAQDRGVILVTAHLGNWDLAGVYLTSLGYPLVAVAEPIAGGHTEALRRYRSRAGMEVVMVTEPVKMLQTLREKKVLVLAGDRDLTGTGIELDFFNGRRSIPKGPAALALKTGAALLTGYFLLNPRKGARPYLGLIEPAIEYKPTGDWQEDVNRLTKILNERLGRVIRAYPDQWFVFQPDWR